MAQNVDRPRIMTGMKLAARKFASARSDDWLAFAKIMVNIVKGAGRLLVNFTLSRNLF